MGIVFKAQDHVHQRVPFQAPIAINIDDIRADRVVHRHIQRQSFPLRRVDQKQTQRLEVVLRLVEHAETIVRTLIVRHDHLDQLLGIGGLGN